MAFSTFDTLCSLQKKKRLSTSVWTALSAVSSYSKISNISTSKHFIDGTVGSMYMSTLQLDLLTGVKPDSYTLFTVPNKFSDCMHNPFSIYWIKNWTFQIVHMEGGIYIEAKTIQDGVLQDVMFMSGDIGSAALVFSKKLLISECNKKN